MLSLRAEGFSCSLGVLYEEMAIFDQEIKNKISSCKFFPILGHQTLNPDPEYVSAIRKNDGSGSGSALNQCGSDTLPLGSRVSI
jgi:hypothetical protein